MMSEPPKTSGLRSDSHISWGTLAVRDDNAAPMPSVIMTAGKVQHTSVDTDVNKATVGAAVSRKATLDLVMGGLVTGVWRISPLCG